MSTLADVKKIALKLPKAIEWRDGHSHKDQWSAWIDREPKPARFVWVWLERVDPKKARVPNDGVIVIPTADLSDKDMLLASDPDKFFADPHYNGYPAIQVRLEHVTTKELGVLVKSAYKLVEASPAKKPRKPRSRKRG